MILAPGVTAADRRRAVRSLANISDQTEDDDSIDQRVENWDSVGRAYFEAPDADAPGGDLQAEPYLRDIITFSNLQAAASVLNSLGGPDNLAAAAAHRDAAKGIVRARNNKAEEQGGQSVSTTGGIAGYQRGDFG